MYNHPGRRSRTPLLTEEGSGADGAVPSRVTRRHWPVAIDYLRSLDCTFPRASSVDGVSDTELES